MRNRQRDYMFDYFIQGLDKTAQATLRMMYNNSCMIDEAERRREKEELKKEIAQYVIDHIKATVDISEVLLEIEELRKAIESLGK